MTQELDFAQRLLLGSAEIDRKERDIAQLVGMVCGLMSNRSSRQPITVATNQWVEWVIDLRPEGDKFIRCYMRHNFEVVYHHTLTGAGTNQLHAAAVRKVHDSLSDFAVGMRETFPEIAEKLRPFEDAAIAA